MKINSLNRTPRDPIELTKTTFRLSFLFLCGHVFILHGCCLSMPNGVVTLGGSPDLLYITCLITGLLH